MKVWNLRILPYLSVDFPNGEADGGVSSEAGQEKETATKRHGQGRNISMNSFGSFGGSECASLSYIIYLYLCRMGQKIPLWNWYHVGYFT
jgi:hypothetical protein